MDLEVRHVAHEIDTLKFSQRVCFRPSVDIDECRCRQSFPRFRVCRRFIVAKCGGICCMYVARCATILHSLRGREKL